MRLIELTCNECGKNFVKPLKDYKSELKRNPNKKFYCSRLCFNHKINTSKIVSCEACGADAIKSQAEISKSEHHFCSHNCAATFTNKLRSKKGYSTKGKTKHVNCIVCNEKTIVSVHVSNNKVRCANCNPPKPKKRIKNNSECKKRCLLCEDLVTGRRKYCDSCLPTAHQNAGLKSASTQRENKRSKNEKLFASLCQEHFNKITTNDPLFNNWDADVLVWDYKIAVLWNGPWHYVYCGGRHSIKQVQSRDKIKLKMIERCGWKAYIIKDFDNFSHGKFSEKFVKQEFEAFKKYVESKVEMVGYQ